MMITKDEFLKAFRDTMTDKMSTKDFAKLALEYLKSPDYNRWKAVQAAEDLKRWREGRDHLMALIEEEQKAGTKIDYEIVPLGDGHDSIRVILNGCLTLGFPSFFSKECIDLNWQHVMEEKARVKDASQQG